MAIVFIPDASEPELGSVNPRAPKRSPLARGVTYFCRCDSLPY